MKTKYESNKTNVGEDRKLYLENNLKLIRYNRNYKKNASSSYTPISPSKEFGEVIKNHSIFISPKKTETRNSSLDSRNQDEATWKGKFCTKIQISKKSVHPKPPFPRRENSFINKRVIFNTGGDESWNKSEAKEKQNEKSSKSGIINRVELYQSKREKGPNYYNIYKGNFDRIPNEDIFHQKQRPSLIHRKHIKHKIADNVKNIVKFRLKYSENLTHSEKMERFLSKTHKFNNHYHSYNAKREKKYLQTLGNLSNVISHPRENHSHQLPYNSRQKIINKKLPLPQSLTTMVNSVYPTSRQKQQEPLETANSNNLELNKDPKTHDTDFAFGRKCIKEYFTNSTGFKSKKRNHSLNDTYFPFGLTNYSNSLTNQKENSRELTKLIRNNNTQSNQIECKRKENENKHELKETNQKAKNDLSEIEKKKSRNLSWTSEKKAKKSEIVESKSIYNGMNLPEKKEEEKRNNIKIINIFKPFPELNQRKKNKNHHLYHHTHEFYKRITNRKLFNTENIPNDKTEGQSDSHNSFMNNGSEPAKNIGKLNKEEDKRKTFDFESDSSIDNDNTNNFINQTKVNFNKTFRTKLNFDQYERAMKSRFSKTRSRKFYSSNAKKYKLTPNEEEKLDKNIENNCLNSTNELIIKNYENNKEKSHAPNEERKLKSRNAENLPKNFHTNPESVELIPFKSNTASSLSQRYNTLSSQNAKVDHIHSIKNRRKNNIRRKNEYYNSNDIGKERMKERVKKHDKQAKLLHNLINFPLIVHTYASSTQPLPTIMNITTTAQDSTSTSTHQKDSLQIQNVNSHSFNVNLKLNVQMNAISANNQPNQNSESYCMKNKYDNSQTKTEKSNLVRKDSENLNNNCESSKRNESEPEEPKIQKENKSISTETNQFYKSSQNLKKCNREVLPSKQQNIVFQPFLKNNKHKKEAKSNFQEYLQKKFQHKLAQLQKLNKLNSCKRIDSLETLQSERISRRTTNSNLEDANSEEENENIEEINTEEHIKNTLKCVFKRNLYSNLKGRTLFEEGNSSGGKLRRTKTQMLMTKKAGESSNISPIESDEECSPVVPFSFQSLSHCQTHVASKYSTIDRRSTPRTASIPIGNSKQNEPNEIEEHKISNHEQDILLHANGDYESANNNDNDNDKINVDLNLNVNGEKSGNGERSEESGICKTSEGRQVRGNLGRKNQKHLRIYLRTSESTANNLQNHQKEKHKHIPLFQNSALTKNKLVLN